jgi:hypothetical protein
MRRCTDPLALDPFSPIGISPIADISSTTDPLALEPLSPLSARARPIDAGFFAADAALGPPRYFGAVGTRTRDSTRHSPRRERAHAGSKLTA